MICLKSVSHLQIVKEFCVIMDDKVGCRTRIDEFGWHLNIDFFKPYLLQNIYLFILLTVEKNLYSSSIVLYFYKLIEYGEQLFEMCLDYLN